MKQHGAAKGRISIRMMGAASMPYARPDTGTRNSVFVREFVHRKNLNILNEDLGGNYIRRVHFFPATGRCVRRVLRRAPDYALMQDVEAEHQMRHFGGLKD
jgi:chemotaxis protein CheD